MRLNQQGIGTTSIIIVIAVLSLVGFTGWYVAKENNKKNNSAPYSQQAQTAQYTDSSKTYSVLVPASWTTEEDTPCCHGEIPDFSKVSQSVRFTPVDSVKNNAVRVQADSGTSESKENWKLSGGSLASHIRSHWQIVNNSPQANTDNGNKIEYVRNHFKGDAEEYVDHQYLVTRGGKAVYLVFREFYTHPMSDNVWNDTKHLQDFRAIVHSVQFTD